MYAWTRPHRATDTQARAVAHRQPNGGRRTYAVRRSFDLQTARFGSGHDAGVIHRLHTRRTYLEDSRVDHLEQIEILLLALREVSLEDSHAIVVQFAAGEIVLPPRRARPQLVPAVALNELSTRRNRVFQHQVLPYGTGHREAHRKSVAGCRRTGERRQIVDDLVAFLDRRQLEVLAQDVERSITGLLKLIVGGVIFQAGGVIQPSLPRSDDAYVVDARLEPALVEGKFGHPERGGLIELFGKYGHIVDQHRSGQVGMEFAGGFQVIGEAVDHHGGRSEEHTSELQS